MPRTTRKNQDLKRLSFLEGSYIYIYIYTYYGTCTSNVYRFLRTAHWSKEEVSWIPGLPVSRWCPSSFAKLMSEKLPGVDDPPKNVASSNSSTLPVMGVGRWVSIKHWWFSGSQGLCQFIRVYIVNGDEKKQLITGRQHPVNHLGIWMGTSMMKHLFRGTTINQNPQISSRKKHETCLDIINNCFIETSVSWTVVWTSLLRDHFMLSLGPTVFGQQSPVGEIQYSQSEIMMAVRISMQQKMAIMAKDNR